MNVFKMLFSELRLMLVKVLKVKMVKIVWGLIEIMGRIRGYDAM